MGIVHSPRCITTSIAHYLSPSKIPPRSTFLSTPSLRHHICRTPARMASSAAAEGSNKTTSEAAGQVAGNSETTPDVIVQYVVLRRDLIDTWPLGSVVTQGCHASVAAIWSHKDDAHTVDYSSPNNLDSMHKVTLEVKGETQIRNLSEKLTSGGITHKLWIEHPENIPTCLATKPYPNSVVLSFFKKLKLCKRWYSKVSMLNFVMEATYLFSKKSNAMCIQNVHSKPIWYVLIG